MAKQNISSLEENLWNATYKLRADVGLNANKYSIFMRLERNVRCGNSYPLHGYPARDSEHLPMLHRAPAYSSADERVNQGFVPCADTRFITRKKWKICQQASLVAILINNGLRNLSVIIGELR